MIPNKYMERSWYFFPYGRDDCFVFIIMMQVLCVCSGTTNFILQSSSSILQIKSKCRRTTQKKHFWSIPETLNTCIKYACAGAII